MSPRPPAIAYLVLAHHHPHHFGRLVRALLRQRHARIFVHLDRKTDIAPFLAVARDERVAFVAPRLRVSWGDYSIVAATLALLRAALPHAVDYLCLLSGVDYPVRSPEHIERFFASHRGDEFINCVRMPDVSVDKPLSRLTRYRLFQPSRGRLRPLAQRALDRLVRRDWARHLQGLVPHAGSQWWALTAAAGRYILEFAATHPHYVRFFRHVVVPDEAFFQTILANSPFAPNIHRNLTTVCWPPGASSPAVLDRTQVRRLAGTHPLVLNGPYGRGEVLFARKFPDDSAELVHLLDHP